MKDLNENIISPMEFKVSFNKLLERYEQLAKSEDLHLASKAKHILEVQKPYPILRDGFCDWTLLDTYQDQIKVLLQDSFADVLTHNEIKTASLPLHDVIFNSSERFKKIISEAGEDFKISIHNLNDAESYVFLCIIILHHCYDTHLNFKRPFFYEIPDDKGIIRHYKILYNADFIEVERKPETPKITEKDLDLLLDNFDDIDLWKEKFPPNGYVLKGFVLSNIFDVTNDQAISNIKSNLISRADPSKKDFIKDFENIFQTFFGLRDLKVGFSIYNKEDVTFERAYGQSMSSYLLDGKECIDCSDFLSKWSFNRLLNEKKFFAISDIESTYEKNKTKKAFLKHLLDKGVKSAIFAPIVNQEGLLGVLELVSFKPKELNSINAQKLADVMPHLVDAVENAKKEYENMVEAVIQQECTSIHPSVHWKFRRAAEKFIKENILENHNTSFSKISFDEVYPLFGQIDVSGSSEARNQATKKDLKLQLHVALKIINQAREEKVMPIYDHMAFQVQEFVNQIEGDFKVDSERQITYFFKKELSPFFELLRKSHPELKNDIADYFKKIDEDLDVIYHYRKNYDKTIRLLNRNMANLLDKRQLEAQDMYPHFFERFKTDGVEHNMYIGESITKETSFNIMHLYNLRLWQMQVMCEMENEFYNNQHLYPVNLEVASMILVFNQPLSIRFRMDEKQFDVDGSYNARYEVVKKRVDKAFIKGTEQRVTESGKLCVVYSQSEDEEEYLRYIKFLQSKHVLGDDVEVVELQDLQGVTGLKAIRVSILYTNNEEDQKNGKSFYNYNDLMETIKS